jgi:opacity protein-like surface antigen
MMKIKTLLTAAAVVLPMSAMSAVNPYVGAKIGTTLGALSEAPFDRVEPGFSGSVYIGANVWKGLSFDVEYAYFNYSDDFEINLGAGTELESDLSIGANRFMLNTSYEFDNKSKFTPYLTAGIGLSYLDVTREIIEEEFDKVVDRIVDNDKYTGFAWQIGLGVNYELNSNVDLGLGYRYIAAGGIEDVDLNGHEISVSAKYKF